jgi:uncharacterized protein with HEPN domain
MFKNDFMRARHMLDAAKEALDFAAQATREDLDDDRKLLLSLLKLIEIIGEAANKISYEAQMDHPEIEWPSIIGMRNKLTHGYFDIDADIVWATILNDLPPLVEKLEEMLSQEANFRINDDCK